jgi:hypothetical protein
MAGHMRDVMEASTLTASKTMGGNTSDFSVFNVSKRAGVLAASHGSTPLQAAAPVLVRLMQSNVPCKPRLKSLGLPSLA